MTNMSQIPPRELSVEAIGTIENRVEHHLHVHPHLVVLRPARLSLLRLSALERLGGVLVLLAGLWALVFWALQ